MRHRFAQSGASFFAPCEFVVRVAALFVDQHLSSIVGDGVGIAIDAIVLVYLFQPRIRQAFRQP